MLTPKKKIEKNLSQSARKEAICSPTKVKINQSEIEEMKFFLFSDDQELQTTGINFFTRNYDFLI